MTAIRSSTNGRATVPELLSSIITHRIQNRQHQRQQGQTCLSAEILGDWREEMIYRLGQ